MEMDFNFACSVNGIMVFPEYPFTDLPRQPQNIMEEIILTGSSTSTSYIQGSADS